MLIFHAERIFVLHNEFRKKEIFAFALLQKSIHKNLHSNCHHDFHYDFRDIIFEGNQNNKFTRRNCFDSFGLQQFLAAARELGLFFRAHKFAVHAFLVHVYFAPIRADISVHSHRIKKNCRAHERRNSNHNHAGIGNCERVLFLRFVFYFECDERVLQHIFACVFMALRNRAGIQPLLRQKFDADKIRQSKSDENNFFALPDCPALHFHIRKRRKRIVRNRTFRHNDFHRKPHRLRRVDKKSK